MNGDTNNQTQNIPEKPEKTKKKEKPSHLSKFNIKEVIGNKKVRYGTFSTITALVAITALIIANLIIGQFDLSYDLTSDKMYSISTKTKDIIGSLEEDITIYALFLTGEDNKLFTEVLEEYSNHSRRIKLVYMDPVLYPSFVYQYQNENGDEIATNSIIVEGKNRFKIIPPGELVTYEIDYNTFSQYPSANNIEPKVTNAIEYVLQTSTPKIYGITGHGETELDAKLLAALDDKNFSYEPLDLLRSEAVPEDCEALIMTTPSRDYTNDETQKIMNYLQNNGKALFVIGSTSFEHPNLDMILNAYGVDFEAMAIFEGESSLAYMMYYFFPILIEHDITLPLNERKTPALVGAPQNITVLDVKKSSLSIETLLTTSSLAYGKTNPQPQSYNKEEGDASGPFNIALAITDSYFVVDTSYKTKIVVSGAPSLLDPLYNEQIYGGNYAFITSSLNWLIEREDSATYISPKSLTNTLTLTMTGAQTGNIKILTIGVIPGIVLIAGIIVWYRRRHK